MLPLIGVTAFVASALTLFSGFGLGTLLLPAFALFMAPEVAVGATAVVHGLNSLFKLVLIGRSAAGRVVVRFGLPAILAAFAGAAILAALAARPPLLVWSWRGGTAAVTPLKLVMGLLILVFALVELAPRLDRIAVSERWLPYGGALSGFFGGLSGHQGALRSIFLRRAGLAPATLAATQAALACMVDVARLAVYGLGAWRQHFAALAAPGAWVPVAVGTACAFAGAILGARLLPKVTVGGLRLLTGILLVVVGTGLAAGIL